MKAITSFLLSVAVLCTCAVPLYAQQGAQAPAQQVSVASPSSSDALGGALDQMGVRKYLLGPGDVLDLRVFGEPQFSGSLVVNDEGNLEVPFIEFPIAARCRTDREIKKDVVTALSKYLKNPQVSLRVTEMKSRPPAVVFGAVRAAQRVQMQRRARLLELLAFSGGVTEQAGGMIQVFHTEPIMCPEPGEVVQVAQQADDVTQVPYSLYNLSDLKAGKDEANPYIRPGDIVIVQEAAPIYITGAVVSPQGIYMRDNMPISRAIAMVGGLRREAKASAIKVYRLKPGSSHEQEILTVDYNAIRKQKQEDFLLKPYDVIEVVDNSGSLGNTLKGFLTGSLSGAAVGIGTNLPLRVLY